MVRKYKHVYVDYLQSNVWCFAGYYSVESLWIVNHEFVFLINRKGWRAAALNYWHVYFWFLFYVLTAWLHTELTFVLSGDVQVMYLIFSWIKMKYTLTLSYLQATDKTAFMFLWLQVASLMNSIVKLEPNCIDSETGIDPDQDKKCFN